MRYGLRGFGDAATAVPAATPATPAAPQYVLTTDKYGETFWDFVDASSSLDFAGFLNKYRVAIGIGAALLLGSMFLLKRGPS